MTTATAVALAGGFKAGGPDATLPTFANLALFMRADAASATEWDDRGPDALTFTASGNPSIAANIFGSKKGVLFDAASRYSATATVPLRSMHNGAGVTYIALIKSLGSHESGEGVLISTGGYPVTLDRGGTLSHSSSSEMIRIAAMSGTDFVLDVAGSASSAVNNEILLVRAQFKTALTPDADVLIGGASTGTGDVTSAPSAGGAMLDCSIGRGSLGFFDYNGFHGYIGELAVIAGIPSAGELSDYFDYLVSYYGIEVDGV